jgi:signal transduction histidine kinase
MEQKPAAQKILVIDDEDNYRNIISMALSVNGYEIIEATNGLDGLAAAKMHKPDLILCDINMPKMDGHALLTALKEDSEFVGIPFIFLTGNAGQGDLRKGMQLGADDYLTKPFSMVELVNAVETRLTKNKRIQKYFESQFDDIKSSFVLSLPHEFRTPLNGILGFSQILTEERDITADEVKEIGTMIHRSGKRLHRLLENMVLFGQLQVWLHDQNKIVEFRRDNSTTLLEVVRSIAEHQMLHHNRPDAVRYPVNDAVLRIASLHLTKILEELIDNALKFSKPGSSVHITSDETPGEITIVVRDMGRGMSQEQISRISGFQQFQRNYYEQQGAGLGLTITQMLAELYGGSISITSEENTGTAVSVVLPKIQ